MSDAFKTALVRAAISGVVLAGSAFFGALAGDLAVGQHLGALQLETAGIAAGVVFFGNVGLRGGIEGYIDTRAAAAAPPKAA